MIDNQIEKRVQFLFKLIVVDLVLMIISGLVMLFALHYVDMVLYITVVLTFFIFLYWRYKLRCPKCGQRIYNILKIERCDNCGVYFK